MEDEIDLRKYVDVLVRRWTWIAGATLLAAFVVGIISFLIPPTYETTSNVFVLSSTSPNASQILSPLSPQTQLALLQSSTVAQQVARSLTTLSADEKRSLLNGSSVRVIPDPVDKSLFRITAQANTAQKSADIANAWANAGADLIDQEQSQTFSQTTSTLQTPADAAAQDLQVAEENLAQKQRNLQVDLLTQELNRTLGILTQQTAERENVKAALAQAQALKQQVDQGQTSLSGDMLSNLQTMASVAGNALLIQPAQLASLNKQQQIDQLNAVIAALGTRQQALSTSIDSVSAHATTLQKQLNDAQTALIEPTRTRDTARANYDLATTRLRDAQMQAALNSSPARALLNPIIPDTPVAPKKTQNVAIAAIVGLLVGVFGVFAVDYLAQPRSS